MSKQIYISRGFSTPQSGPRNLNDIEAAKLHVRESNRGPEPQYEANLAEVNAEIDRLTPAGTPRRIKSYKPGFQPGVIVFWVIVLFFACAFLVAILSGIQSLVM